MPAVWTGSISCSDKGVVSMQGGAWQSWSDDASAEIDDVRLRVLQDESVFQNSQLRARRPQFRPFAKFEIDIGELLEPAVPIRWSARRAAGTPSGF